MISASISVMDHTQRIGFIWSVTRQGLTAGCDSVSSVPSRHSDQNAQAMNSMYTRGILNLGDGRRRNKQDIDFQ